MIGVLILLVIVVAVLGIAIVKLLGEAVKLLQRIAHLVDIIQSDSERTMDAAELLARRVRP